MHKPGKRSVERITAEMQELIRSTASETASETVKAATAAMLPTVQVDYYHIVERILQNYKTIKRMIADEQQYIDTAIVDRPERSKDIVIYSSKPAGDGAPDATTVIEQQRIRSFQRTCAQFEEIDRVIQRFADKPEFVVVKMYYFNEDVDGVDRGGQPVYTWEQIAEELSARGILHTDRTARKWRSNILSDMAVCMFGVKAAVAEGVHWTKQTMPM